MANIDSTSSINNETPETLEGKFPCNCNPYSVWYNKTAWEEGSNDVWAINDSNGNGYLDFQNYEKAIDIADALKIRDQLYLRSYAKEQGGLNGAVDKLNEAAYLAEFIQSISLNVPSDGALELQPAQLTGFYFAMQNTIDRIREAASLISAARARQAVNPA